MRSLLFLLIATSALAQVPPTVPSSPPTEATRVYPSKSELAVAVLRSREAKSQWRVFAIDFDQRTFVNVQPEVIEDGMTCVIEGPAGSQCAVMRFGPDGTQKDTNVIVLGGARPPPKPPVTTPENPTNPPLPAPGLPLTGMRVLILEERNPASPLPLTLQRALQSREVQTYLDIKALNSDGSRRWRRLDPTSSLANLSPEWQALRAAVPTTIDQPQVVIAGSSAGGVETVAFVGPYPDDEAKALELFKKYGG